MGTFKIATYTEKDLVLGKSTDQLDSRDTYTLSLKAPTWHTVDGVDVWSVGFLRWCSILLITNKAGTYACSCNLTSLAWRLLWQTVPRKRFADELIIRSPPSHETRLPSGLHCVGRCHAAGCSGSVWPNKSPTSWEQNMLIFRTRSPCSWDPCSSSRGKKTSRTRRWWELLFIERPLYPVLRTWCWKVFFSIRGHWETVSITYCR